MILNSFCSFTYLDFQFPYQPTNQQSPQNLTFYSLLIHSRTHARSLFSVPALSLSLSFFYFSPFPPSHPPTLFHTSSFVRPPTIRFQIVPNFGNIIPIYIYKYIYKYIYTLSQPVCSIFSTQFNNSKNSFILSSSFSSSTLSPTYLAKEKNISPLSLLINQSCQPNPRHYPLLLLTLLQQSQPLSLPLTSYRKRNVT